MSSSAMWYKNGNFYEVPTTHIDFFLQNPELLGFSQEEKEQLCIDNGIPADSTTWLDTTQERTDILLEVLKRGAIRIRFYGGKTSVQCYDRTNKYCYEQLKNCVIDGYGKCFGNILTVMDTKGWGEMLNDMGWGMQIKDFISSSAHRQNYKYFNIYKEKPMNGYEINQLNLSKVLEDNYTNTIYSCFINSKKVHTKARNEFKDKLIGTDSDNTVLTWAIGTPENPMKEKSTDADNKQRCLQFENMLTRGHFDFEKIHGQYGNEEHSYFIPNITIEDAKNIFKNFGQESFIFGQKDYDKETNRYYLEMEFWQRESTNQNFELVDMESKVEDTPDAVDYFSKTHGFKFNIPFSIFQASQRFFERYNWKTPSQLNSEAFVYIANAHKHVGSNCMNYRGRMYHKPQSWELSNGLRNQYYYMWKSE